MQVVDAAVFGGDLDGDGVEDAVVFLIEWGGGSGVFIYVGENLSIDLMADGGTMNFAPAGPAQER